MILYRLNFYLQENIRKMFRLIQVHANNIVFFSQKGFICIKLNKKLSYLFTDSLMYEINTKNVYQDFIKDKEMSDFSICSAKLNYHDD